MDIVLLLVFIWASTCYVGGFPGPITSVKWVKKKVDNHLDKVMGVEPEDKYSRQRLSALERESMAYWEKRFIEAGGKPEKKVVIEPDAIASGFISITEQMDHELRIAKFNIAYGLPPGGKIDNTRTRQNSSQYTEIRDYYRQMGRERPVSSNPIRVDYAKYQSK